MMLRSGLAGVRATGWMTMVLGLVTLGGCSGSDQTTSPPSDDGSAFAASTDSVPTVSLPDPTTMEEWIQDEIRERYATVQNLQSQESRASDQAVASAYGSLGLALMAAKQYDPAAACYLNAIALVPHDMRWLYYMGRLRLITQEWAEAAEWFERVLEFAPSDEATLVSLGRIYFDQGRFSEAERLFTHATVIAPRSAAAWAGLGQTALAEGDHRRAAESLERALEIDPGGAQAHYPLAMAYRALGETDLAAAHLERRGKRQPLLADPLMLEYLEAALRLVPDFAEAQAGLAALLEIDGRLPEAIDRYRLALESEPSFVEARIGLAQALHASDRLEEALPHYLQVTETEPGFVEAWLWRAEALIQLERYAEAREWVTAARRVHPEHSDIRRLAEAFDAAPRP